MANVISDETIEYVGILAKLELSESEKAELDYKLQMACDYPGENPALTITYFVPDHRKAGGSCHTYVTRIPC